MLLVVAESPDLVGMPGLRLSLRRLFVCAIMVAAGAALVAAPADARTRPVARAVSGSTTTCSVSANLVPSCGVWLGADRHKMTGQTWDQAIATHEREIGRSLNVVHNYHRWDEAFPTSAESARAGRGQLLLLNWLTTRADGSSVPWASIASGAEDSQVDATAARIKKLGLRVLLVFQHEPEDKLGVNGTAADYAAAFRHVHDRFALDRVSNVRWVWDVMGLTTSYWQATYGTLYPGDRYVDWVAWDPYNWASCRSRPWQSFAQIVSPFYSWLFTAGHGSKPFMLAEYGSIEDATSVTAKAEWFGAIPAALGSFPNLKALVYFDFPAPPASCTWSVDTSAAAQSAYATITKTPAFAAAP